MGFNETYSDWANHKTADVTLGGLKNLVKKDILKITKDKYFMDDVRKELEEYFK